MHFLEADTGLTEQLFCAVTFLRKELLELRHTLVGEDQVRADAIEAWCNALTEDSSSIDLTNFSLRAHKKNKVSYIPVLIGGAVIAAAAVGVIWLYHINSTVQRDGNYIRHSQPVINSYQQIPLPYCSEMSTVKSEGDLFVSTPFAQVQPTNIVRKHLQRQQELECSSLKKEEGTQCVPKPLATRLQELQDHFPSLVVKEVGDHEMRFDTQSSDIKGLLLAASLPEISNEHFQWSCEEVAAKQSATCDSLELPGEGALFFRQQKLHELFSQPDLFENYVMHALRDAESPGFFKFCKIIFSQLNSRTHPVLGDKKCVFEAFVKRFVLLCSNEVSACIQNRFRPYNGIIIQTHVLQVRDIAQVKEFTKVCCADLFDLLLLIKDDPKQDEIIDRLIEIGFKNIASAVRRESVQESSVSYVKASMIGELSRSKRLFNYLKKIYEGGSKAANDACLGVDSSEEAGSNDDSCAEEGGSSVVIRENAEESEQ